MSLSPGAKNASRFVLMLLITGLVMGCATVRTKRGLKQLDRELQQLSDSTLIPGFAVALVHNNSVRFSKAYGFSDIQTHKPFTIQSINSVASISKTIIALAVMKLVDEGKLSLDTRINSILPYKIRNPHSPATDITIRHLVTHTSGLSQEFDPEDVGQATIYLVDNFADTSNTPEQLKKEIAYYRLGKPISIEQHVRNFTQPGAAWYSPENFLNFPAGAKFNYTNLGALVAADVVEKVSGQPFEEYTRQRFFDPLHMSNTAWSYARLNRSLFATIYTADDRAHPTRAIAHPKYEMTDYPVGGLKTNIEDLSKYLVEMIKGNSGEGSLVSAASYQTMFRPQLSDSCFQKRDNYIFNDQYNVGVFWAISQPGYVMHNGGSIGVYSFIYFNPGTATGAVAFCNLPHPDFGKVREIIHKYEAALFTGKTKGH